MGPPAASLTLVVEKGPRNGETIERRPGGRVRIGRVLRGNNFTIKDAGISQAHLSIEAGAGGAGWVLTDLGSSNGTILNGVRVAPSNPAPLRDGDAIKIGEETAIRVQIAEAEASAPTPGPRRNPRRGRSATVAEAPQEDTRGGARGRGRSRKVTTAAGGARGRGRPRKVTTAGGETACDEDRLDPPVEENVKESRKTTAVPRGKGRGRGAAAAPTCLDSISEESGREDLRVVESRILKEVKQEISDSVEIMGVKGSKAGVGRGKRASGRVLSVAGAQEAEQVRGEEETDAPAPLREEQEEGVPVENPGAEAAREDMENMTLDEWFDRMEKYIPKVINQIAEEVISEIKAKASRFNEYVGSCTDSEQQDLGGGFVGLM